MCLLRVYAWTFIPVPINTGRSMCRVAESCFKILWNVRNVPLAFHLIHYPLSKIQTGFVICVIEILWTEILVPWVIHLKMCLSQSVVSRCPSNFHGSVRILIISSRITWAAINIDCMSLLKSDFSRTSPTALSLVVLQHNNLVFFVVEKTEHQKCCQQLALSSDFL